MSAEHPLVDRAIALGVADQRVLDAMRRLPRSAFVPVTARAVADRRDAPILIAHGQTTSQPSLVAFVVAELALSATDRVLEIGSGLGYQTALLASVAGHVWSVDRFADLVDEARDNLRDQGITNVTLRCADGTEGLAEHAPFDAIVVSAAFADVPPPLCEQLAEGGRLIQPLGGARGDELVRFVKRDGVLVVDRRLGSARYVPLRGRYGVQTGESTT